MIKIFELEETNEVEKLEKADFKIEEEIEDILEENPQIVGSSVVLARQKQVDFAGIKHIPDLIGVNGEGRIQVIELKNRPTDLDILPQVLRYQSSAKKYPSDIKLMWETSDVKTEGKN